MFGLSLEEKFHKKLSAVIHTITRYNHTPASVNDIAVALNSFIEFLKELAKEKEEYRKKALLLAEKLEDFRKEFVTQRHQFSSIRDISQQLVKQFNAVLGEELTPKTFVSRHRDKILLERLRAA